MFRLIFLLIACAPILVQGDETGDVTDKISDYLSTHYFSPKRPAEFCIEGDSDCTGTSVKIRAIDRLKSTAAYLAVGDCSGIGTCQYWLFSSSNQYMEPILETQGFSFEVERAPAANPDITVLDKASLALQYKIVYKYSIDGVYRPCKCFTKKFLSSGIASTAIARCSEILDR